jgi:DNA-binding transcriptional MocR family regulator
VVSSSGQPLGVAIRTHELVALLGDWASDRQTLYESLADRILQLVERGDLVPGAALPAERSLASALNVSRGTVMNSFMLLRERAVIESRQGSGTRIRMDVARPLLPDVDLMGMAAASRSLAGRLFDPDPASIDLAVSMLHDAEAVEHLTPPSNWSRIEEATNGHGYAPQGLPQLREGIAQYFHDRGLRTSADQVLVTGGAQQALDLCAELALKPGDTVLVESPTYPGAIDIFARHGARVTTFPFCSHRDRPRQLREIVRAQAPRLLYLMPQIHKGAAPGEGGQAAVGRVAWA